MANESQIQLDKSDFSGLGKKLEALHASLPPAEQALFEYLMEAAAAGAGQAPPPPWMHPKFKYKPRGAKALVVGGSDGLTVLINSHGQITVVHPEGPLPTDRTSAGAIPFQGERFGQG